MKKTIVTNRITSGRMGMVSVRPLFLMFAVAVCLMLAGCDFNFDWNKKDSEKTPAKVATPVETKKYAADLELKGLSRGDGEEGFSVQPSIYRQGSDLKEIEGGSVSVVLPPKTFLAYQSGRKKTLDISIFTHLTFEMEYLGDMGKCVVIIDSESGPWTSKPIPVSRGVNQVMFSVHKLWRSVDFDVRKVQAVRIGFPDSDVKSEFVLRNLRFIRDLKNINPVPAGMVMDEIGRDYIMRFVAGNDVMELVRSDDGLWRFGLNQPVVRLARFGANLSESGGEELDAMGRDRFGEVELLEHNILRVQLADSWYFTGFEGGIKAFSNRYIHWVYTIYGDGRCIVAAELDNSGGPELGKVEICLRSQRAAWYGGSVNGSMLDDSFIGPVGKWTFMTVIGEKNRPEFFRDYLNPARIRPILAKSGTFAPGDSDKDGFDESQGCYYLAARPSGCKFEVICNQKGLLMPIFRIIGPWKKLPAVVVEGRRVEKAVLLGDGSVMFELPGEYRKNFIVEVLGATGQ